MMLRLIDGNDDEGARKTHINGGLLEKYYVNYTHAGHTRPKIATAHTVRAAVQFIESRSSIVSTFIHPASLYSIKILAPKRHKCIYYFY